MVGVIAYSLSRLYRNLLQFLTFLDRCESLNKQIFIVKETIDTGSAIGRAMVSILMLIYQLESDQTSERMKEGIQYRREKMGRHWGPLPYGVDRDEQGGLIPTTRTYHLNGVERRYIDALHFIYTQYATGQYGFNALALAANQAGWRYYTLNSEAQKFTGESIRRIIAAWQLYQGNLPVGKLQNKKDDTAMTGSHAPILPPELCALVGEIRAGRSWSFSKPVKESTTIYLLSDVAYCGVCGQKMVGNLDHGRERYRHQHQKEDCPEKWAIPMEPVEQEIINTLERFAAGNFVDLIRAELAQLIETVLSDIDNSGIRTELNEYREKLTRLEDIYLDGDIDKPSYIKRRGALQAKINELNMSIEKQAGINELQVIADRVAGILNRLSSAENPPSKVWSICFLTG